MLLLIPTRQTNNPLGRKKSQQRSLTLLRLPCLIYHYFIKSFTRIKCQDFHSQPEEGLVQPIFPTTQNSNDGQLAPLPPHLPNQPLFFTSPPPLLIYLILLIIGCTFSKLKCEWKGELLKFESIHKFIRKACTILKFLK